MSEFFAFFLILFFFEFNAFCMNPWNTGLPSPPTAENIELGDCFVVPEITGDVLKTAIYNYQHICPEKDRYDGPELSKDGKLWYFLGSCKNSRILSQNEDPPSFHYLRTKQSLIKFVSMKEEMVELVFTFAKLQIIFQSPQQSRTFYRMIYNDVRMSKAAPQKIGMLHEMIFGETEYFRKMGDNVEALYEYIYGKCYITFRNERGEPLLIFSHDEAFILLISKPWLTDKLQLLLRINLTFYILTFSSHDKAKQFSEALLQFLKALHLGRIADFPRRLFENNGIKIVDVS